MSTEEQGLEVSPVSAWKKASLGTPLRVPSGNTCLVKPANMETFIRKNLIPNELIPIITAGMKSKTTPATKDLVENLDNEMMLKVFEAMDAVVQEIVMEPKIFPQPAATDERNPDALYIDEIDMEDKIFIWQYAVGGTRDLEKFRREFRNDVAAVQQGQDVVDEAVKLDRTGE